MKFKTLTESPRDGYDYTNIDGEAIRVQGDKFSFHDFVKMQETGSPEEMLAKRARDILGKGSRTVVLDVLFVDAKTARAALAKAREEITKETIAAENECKRLIDKMGR